MNTRANREAAAVLANELFPHIEKHAKQFGASNTIIEGLWALAHIAAYLICSPGIDREKARRGFIKAIDLNIATNGEIEQEEAVIKH
jgi:hypothetical protein